MKGVSLLHELSRLLAGQPKVIMRERVEGRKRPLGPRDHSCHPHRSRRHNFHPRSLRNNDYRLFFHQTR